VSRPDRLRGGTERLHGEQTSWRTTEDTKIGRQEQKGDHRALRLATIHNTTVEHRRG